MSFSAGQLENRIREYMAACTSGDADAIVAHLSHDATHYFPPDMYDGPWRGGRFIAQRWAEAVRDRRSAWTVDAVAIDVDRQSAVCEWTHFKNAAGVILRGAEWYEFDDDGLIKEIRAYYASPQEAGIPRLELGGFDYVGRGYPTAGNEYAGGVNRGEEPEPSATAVDEWATVRRLLADQNYLVLGTADAAGAPWVSPVFFATADQRRLFWVSSPGARHSGNVAQRPAVAITIFDSTAPVGGAEALYLEADLVDIDDVAAGLEVLNAKLPTGMELSTDDLAPAGTLQVFGADVSRYFVLIRGSDARFDNVTDMRLEVHPE